jgi:hypothetical protein
MHEKTKRRTKKVASVAFTGTAAAALVGVNTGPALATGGTFKVSNGTTPYTGAYSGTFTSGMTFVDTTHPFTLTCTSAWASGSIPHSAGTASKSAVGTVAAGATIIHCSLLGTTFNAKLIKATKLWVTGATTGGVTPGYVGSKGNTTAISLSWIGSGNNCHATITGSSVPGQFVNSLHELKLNAGKAATLTIHSPTNCPVIQNNDKAYFTANYKVTTPTALNITDP